MKAPAVILSGHLVPEAAGAEALSSSTWGPGDPHNQLNYARAAGWTEKEKQKGGDKQDYSKDHKHLGVAAGAVKGPAGIHRRQKGPRLPLAIRMMPRRVP